MAGTFRLKVNIYFTTHDTKFFNEDDKKYRIYMRHKVSLFLLSFTESMYGRVPVSVVTHVVMPPYLLRATVITNVRVQADEDAVLVQVAGRLSRGPARELRFFVRFRPDKSPWI